MVLQRDLEHARVVRGDRHHPALDDVAAFQRKLQHAEGFILLEERGQVLAQGVGVEAAQALVDVCLGVLHHHKEDEHAQCAGKAHDEQALVEELQGHGTAPDGHPHADGGKAALVDALAVDDGADGDRGDVDDGAGVDEQRRGPVGIDDFCIIYIDGEREEDDACHHVGDSQVAQHAAVDELWEGVAEHVEQGRPDAPHQHVEVELTDELDEGLGQHAEQLYGNEREHVENEAEGDRVDDDAEDLLAVEAQRTVALQEEEQEGEDRQATCLHRDVHRSTVPLNQSEPTVAPIVPSALPSGQSAARNKF